MKHNYDTDQSLKNIKMEEEIYLLPVMCSIVLNMVINKVHS